MRSLALAPIVLVLVACDTPPGGHDRSTDLATDPASNEPDQDAGLPLDADGLPVLVSRFGPTRGLVGAQVTLLTAFEPRGCATRGDCAVTIGGVPAQITRDEGLLEVVVPIGADTGPVCLTLLGRVECKEDFTVLVAPLVYSLSPAAVAVGEDDVTLHVYGEAFLPDALVVVDWQRLETTWLSDGHLTATVPASLVASGGSKTVTVYTSRSSRCGSYSEPLTLVVE